MFRKEQKLGVRTVLFSFWGTGLGYSIPWLSQVFDGTAVGLHGGDLYEERAGVIALQRAVISSARRVLPVSSNGRDYILAKYPGLSREKVGIMYLGVEGPGGTPNNSFQGTIEVVSCSSLIRIKRVDLILQVVEELARRRGKVNWSHFGSGPLSPTLERLANIATAQNKDLTVSLMGHKKNSEVMRFLANRDVSLFINLSSTEGIPVSIMEAASCGIPTVATNVGGVSELVGEELGTGILVNSDPSVNAVVEAIELIIDAPEGKFDPHIFWKEHFNSHLNSQNLVKDLLSTIH
jgi:glycosyltransferase involved in cell wall biosynthesis